MNNKDPIVAPQSDPQRKLARVIFDSVVGLLPGGSALARIWQFSHPPKSEQEREAWQGVISERSNEHDARLDHHDASLFPHERVTGITAALMVALAHNCPDGLGRRRYELGDLVRLVPDATPQQLRDSAFEMQRLGVVQINHFATATGGAWALKLLPKFYRDVDPQVMKWSAENDAGVIARHMIEANTGRAAAIHKLCGWELRRFNPAYRQVMCQIGANQISKERAGDHPAASILLSSETRAVLAHIQRTR